jgi:hypothetical protein
MNQRRQILLSAAAAALTPRFAFARAALYGFQS